MRKKINILHQKQQIGKTSYLAESLWDRFRGLMLWKNLERETFMVFAHCNSIQTCFMLFPIDVVFVNRTGRILRILENIRPWRFTWPIKDAYYSLEMNAFEARKLGFKEKLDLEILEVDGV